MIYTLTTNPAIDMNVSLKQLVEKKVNRSQSEVYSPRGKGLNLSFALKHFGIDSGILGFFGGFSGEYIVDECRKMGYKIEPVYVDGITRINVFINADETEYNIVNPGPVVDKIKQKQLFEKLKTLPDIDILTINGSAANGMTDDCYDEIF